MPVPKTWGKKAKGAHRRTGAKVRRLATQEIQEEDLVQLAIYRLVRPKAYLDEVIAYLHNRDTTKDPNSHTQIIRAEKRLGLWLKVGSTISDLCR